MRIAICDDEIPCIEYLYEKIVGNKRIQMIHKFNNVDLLLNAIEDGNQYDLVFMDIDWKNKKETGINFAYRMNTMSPEMQIIFVTGYNDIYSQDIFSQPLNLCGYLVKPVESFRLESLIEKAYEKKQLYATDKLILKQRKITYAIPYGEIRYIESRVHQLYIVTKKQTVIYYGKLEEIMKHLPNTFQQCHKSYLVNMNEIRRLEGYKYILSDETHIPISKTRYQKSKSLFFSYMREI